MAELERTELVKSGLDAVASMIEYLAKDAIGAEFLSEYTSSREVQNIATEKQKNALNKLIESSSAMDEETKKISENAGHNIERLVSVYSEIETLRNSVQRIEEEHKHYVEKFKILHQEAKDIMALVEAIQNISEQTNLLSFNASIEAAHAGTVGAGFRIIANEVKKLAGNTKGTTEKIKHEVEKLTKSLVELENGTKSNASSLDGLTKEATETLERFDKVRKLNSENNANVEKISTSISANVKAINSMIKTVQEADDVASKNVELFADCASRNQMLFNDLYSFAYELKAIFEDLK